ncbi:MAG TPA: ABC-F family ATP-binding cassette domain-containing protein [Tepidisphaeraceae bacterium]|nr:ABC-F family ATP-binding cassette domain-containing protein [Tepidisphaeraceae bacterium]
MSVATLSKIEKTFGKRVLFDRLDLNIEQGERVGFIGANGSGKTTVFKVLTGQVIPDAGIVAVSKGTKVGHLTQDPTFEPGNSVMDEAELAFAELHSLSHKLRDIEHEMAHRSGEELEKILRQYQQVQHEFDLAGGYAWRHRLEATLLGVGLGRETWEQSVETLSGGQRSRLALAKLLISEPDLLLLDEPTNHLDLAAIEWLEKYLLTFGGAVVLISHDRYLLDRLATRIAWLTQCKIRSYPGNYTAFVQQRELQELSQQRAFEEQQADIDKQKEFIRRFGAGQRSKEAKGREKRLNRLLKSEQMVDQVDAGKNIRLSLGTDQRAGDQVLDVRGLSKGFDSRQLWNDAKFYVRRGERIGIIGPNGSGKTTLLSTLLGQTDADAGEIRWGANLNIGYYDQRLDDFDPTQTVLEAAWEDRDVKEQQVRDVLATMLFRGEDVNKPVGLLSGGERARVRLSQLLLDKPNVLVLDEPTNHLDIPSREALESTLAGFEGTILCVSHDRYFLAKIANRMLILRPPMIIDFAGGYAEWVRKSDAETQEQRAETSAKPKPKPAASTPARSDAARKKDNPYARPFGRLSLEELEQQITDTEIAIQECQGSFGDAGSFKDPSRGQRLQSEYESLSRKLEALEAEYFAREQ